MSARLLELALLALASVGPWGCLLGSLTGFLTGFLCARWRAFREVRAVFAREIG